MVELRIFVEGGGESSALRRSCRIAFKRFLPTVGAGVILGVRPCGSRGNAYRDFVTAVKQRKPDVLPVLLVDSEAPVGQSHKDKPWKFLGAQRHGKWTRPSGSRDNQAHLMVQFMESWLVCDPAALEEHYGKGFKKDKLPQNKNIEKVSTTEVKRKLNSAIRDTNRGKKGTYEHNEGFAILADLKYAKVEERSVWAKRLFDFLRDFKS